MKLGTYFTICLIALTVITPPVVAEDKPVLVVSISSLDELLGDFGYLAEAVGFPQAGQMGTMMASQYIEGLDTTRPVGIVVRTDGEDIRALGILPVKDLKLFLSGLEAQFGEPEDAGNGVLELAGPAPIYFKENAGWAFIASTSDELLELPTDPVAMFESLNKSYGLAVRGFVQNIPESYREMALAQIKEGVEMGLENLPEDEDSEIQRKVIKNSLEQWESLFEGLDQFTLGWKVDDDNKKVFADVTTTAVAGTRMDRQFGVLNQLKSRFSGFVMGDAAISMNAASKMLQEDIDRTLAVMEPVRAKVEAAIEDTDEIPDGKTKQTIKRLADALIDVAIDTLKTGEFDTGSSVVFDDQGMNMVAGMHVADGAKLEAAIKELAESMLEEPGKPTFQINADQHAGVRFHKISIPVPAHEDEARRAFGESLDIAIGIAKESAYVAAGPRGMALVRQAIDQSTSAGGKPTSPFNLKVALDPIMRFANGVDDNDVVAAIATALEKSKDDEVLVSAKMIEHGATYQLEIHEGVLNAIGEGVQVARAEE